MGSKSDVELAKFLARQAENETRRAESPASSEWRWSSTGWGEWGAERIKADPCPNSTQKPDAGDDTKD
jgi:hypothetical protein